MITCSELHELFEYRDGKLYWKVSNTPRVRIGQRAGSVHRNYRQISISGKKYQEHRIIFMMCNGYLPEILDHANNNGSINKIENLRPATRIQNSYNSKLRKDNKSGFKNVLWSNERKKWRVVIVVNKKQKFIGRFDDLELADLVAQEARDKYHKEFARHL